MSYQRAVFSYKGNDVQKLSDLPRDEYQELLQHLTEWKRKLVEEVIQHHLKVHAPTANIDIQWNTLLMNMNKKN